MRAGVIYNNHFSFVRDRVLGTVITVYIYAEAAVWNDNESVSIARSTLSFFARSRAGIDTQHQE